MFKLYAHPTIELHNPETLNFKIYKNNAIMFILTKYYKYTKIILQKFTKIILKKFTKIIL